MKTITMRFDENTVESLDAEADERELSHSEYLRKIDAQERIRELETENERLKRKKRQILDQREENSELVEYAQNERELQRQERERRDAPAWQRAKWWLLGRD